MSEQTQESIPSRYEALLATDMKGDFAFSRFFLLRCIGGIGLSWSSLLLPASGSNNSTPVHNLAPTPPSSLSVTQASVSGGNSVDPSHVNITWVASSSGSPDSYSVEHNQSSSSWGKIYSGGGLATQDQNLLGNTRHFYRVRAHNQFGWSGYTQIALYSFGVSPDIEVQSWSGSDDKSGLFRAFVSANPDDLEKKNIFKYYCLRLNASDEGENWYVGPYLYEYASTTTTESDSVDISTASRTITTNYTGTTSDKFRYETENEDGYDGTRDPVTGKWTVTWVGSTPDVNGTPWKLLQGYYADMTWQSIPDTASTSESYGTLSYDDVTMHIRTKITLSSEYTTSQMIKKAWGNASTSQSYTNNYYNGNFANFNLDKDSESSVSLTKCKYHFKALYNAIFRKNWSEVTTYVDPQTQPTTNDLTWSSDSGKISDDYSVDPPETNCFVGIQFNNETSLSLYDGFGTLDVLETEKDALGVTSFYIGPNGTTRRVSLSGSGFTVQHQTGGSMETVSGSISLTTDDSGYFTLAPNSQGLSDPKSRLNITGEAYDSNNKSLKQKNATVVFVPVQVKQKNYPISSGSTDLGQTKEKIITRGTNPSSIAYITGDPTMPQLEASIGGGSVSGMSVDWRLVIKTERSERGGCVKIFL